MMLVQKGTSWLLVCQKDDEITGVKFEVIEKNQ